jgi:hypothetical protein
MSLPINGEVDVHNSQANVEILIFPFVCSENKCADSTGLEQLPLKVLDDLLLHRQCHPII